MEFFDLRPGAGKNSERPSVKVVKSTVVFGIPRFVGDQINLDKAGGLHIQVAEATTGLVVKLTPDEKGSWRVKAGRAYQISVPELFPETKWEASTQLDYVVEDASLLLTLPKAWKLLDQTALIKPTRSSRPRPVKAA